MTTFTTEYGGARLFDQNLREDGDPNELGSITTSRK